MEEVLQNIGLNRRESICYMSLLRLGSSKVGDILRETEIPSSKIYEILEKLIKKGLVSYVVKGKIKHYQASDPRILFNYIDNKRKKLEEIMPKLLLKQSIRGKQSVEIYEGRKAIFSLLSNLINDSKPKEKYFVFSINEENKDESANLFFRNITLRRKDKKLDVRLLKNIRFYKREKHTKLKLRFTNFNLPQGITIFRNNVIIISWRKSPTAIKIESDIFSKQFKEFFLEVWEEAKE